MFTFHVTDGLVASNVAEVMVTITPVNDAPVASAGALVTAEDTTASGTLSAVDTEGQSLIYSLIVNGSKGTTTITNSATGAYTYVPTPDANGTDTFTFQVTDGLASSNVAQVAVTITPVNDAPVASAGALVTAEDTTGSGTLSAVDTEGQSLIYNLVANGSKGTATITDSATGVYMYVPKLNANGTDVFTFRVTDGPETSNVAEVTVTITPVNDAPTAGPDSASTAEDTPLSQAAPGVLANDTDADNAPTAVLVAGPSHGTLVLNADGSFTYTPAANYSGPDAFTYKANDGEFDSSVATVHVIVTPVNDKPSAVADSYSTAEDTPLTVSAAGVLANDTDIDANPLTAVPVSAPSSGTLVLNANGSFAYTPAANFNGQVAFTYSATDGSFTSAPTTVTVTVQSVNDAPAGTNKTITTRKNMSYALKSAAFGFSDASENPPNAFLSVKITSLPSSSSAPGS